MSRKRIKQISDLVLKPEEVKRLRKGYRVFKVYNKHTHCIYMENNAKALQIAKLKAKLRMLTKGETNENNG